MTPTPPPADMCLNAGPAELAEHLNVPLLCTLPKAPAHIWHTDGTARWRDPHGGVLRRSIAEFMRREIERTGRPWA